MRHVLLLALLVLAAAEAPAATARAVASATIVVPIAIGSMPEVGAPCVSVETLRDGAYEHVTIAFN